jgi:Tol biopolymer transport system component
LEEILTISVADGSTRSLGTTMDDSYTRRMRFSPDGQHVIYSDLQDANNPERDIFLLSVETGDVAPVIQHPADDFLLGWSADGRWLVFASDRTGSIGLWIVGMADGKRQGPPTLVRDGIGRALPMGLTRDGALFYGIVRVAEDIYLADLDPETGRVVGTPRKAIEDHEGTNYYPSYSPDGKHLAYISKRGSNPYPTNAGNTLCIRSLDTGETREFYREFWRAGIRVIVSPQWFPDGESILLPVSGKDGLALYRFDRMTGEIERILASVPGERLRGGGFGPEGRYFLARAFRQDGWGQIVVMDFDTGAEREIHRFTYDTSRLRLKVSPDGRWFSYLNNDNGGRSSLMIMPAEGGSPREIWSFGETGPGTPTGQHWWTPDGQHILFRSLDDDPYQRELWRVPVQGGQAERIGVFELHTGPMDLTVHPSGRQIAFASRGDFSTASEVWVMENFLPKEEAGAGNGG